MINAIPAMNRMHADERGEREVGKREREGGWKMALSLQLSISLTYSDLINSIFKAEAESAVLCAQFRNQVTSPLSMRSEVQRGIQFDQAMSIER